ncbi:MAG: type III pantothenate kinase [Leptothrix sp. (in: b-proteobacteria)]
MSFLVIDIGNTRLKWGCYRAAEPGADLLAQGAVFLETIEQLAEQDWVGLAHPTAMLGCVVAGDAVRRRAEEQLETWDLTPQWVVSSSAAGGVINGYEHPSRLGSDRWVAMVGARQRLLGAQAAEMPGHDWVDGAETLPAIVVMVGTAVTVDALDGHGRFLGGLILPGFGLMLRALEMGTAGLRVPTGDVTDFPTNTSDALMSGGASGIAGAVERMHRQLAHRTGQLPRVLMSGGAAAKLAQIVDLPVEVVDTLVFEGLLRLAQDRIRAGLA